MCGIKIFIISCISHGNQIQYFNTQFETRAIYRDRAEPGTFVMGMSFQEDALQIIPLFLTTIPELGIQRIG